MDLSKSFRTLPDVEKPEENLIVCDGKSLFPGGEHDLNTYAYLNVASQIGYTVVILTSREVGSEQLVKDVSQRSFDGAFDRFHFAFDTQVEGRTAFVVISDDPDSHGVESKNKWQPNSSQIRKSLAFFGVVDEVDNYFASDEWKNKGQSTDNDGLEQDLG